MLREFSRWEKRIRARSEKLEQAKINRDGSEAIESVRDLAKTVETMCRALREQIIREYDVLCALEMTDNEPLALPNAPNVEVNMEDTILTIQADAMLPFATKGASYYIHQQLDNALSNFLREQKQSVPIFSEPSAILFLHHYDRNGKPSRTRQLRDFDNVEHRAILNTISRYCVWDDSPLNIILMDALVLGDKDFTEILVMPVTRFQDYLMSEKKLALLADF